MVLNVTNHGKQAPGVIVKATRLWMVKANEFNAQSYSSRSYGEPEKKKSTLRLLRLKRQRPFKRSQHLGADTEQVLSC